MGRFSKKSQRVHQLLRPGERRTYSEVGVRARPFYGMDWRKYCFRIDLGLKM
jgi:hypothetical protein